MERPSNWPKVIQETIDLIEYHPEWRCHEKFWVPHGSDSLRKHLDIFSEMVAPVYRSGVGHPREELGGYRFGSSDPKRYPDRKNIDELLCLYFSKGPYAQKQESKTSETSEGSKAPEPLSTSKSPGRKIPNSAIGLKYPLDQLEEVGEYFLVTNRVVAQIAPHVSTYMKMANNGKVFRCLTVSEGTLVVLIENPGKEYTTRIFA